MTVKVYKISSSRQTWYLRINYRHHEHRTSAFTRDKAIAHDIASQIERLMVCQQRREKPDAELLEWAVSILDPRIHARLIEWGILDPQAADALRPIHQIVTEWSTSLADRKRTSKHASQCQRHLLVLFAAAAINKISQITAEAIDFAITALNKGGEDSIFSAIDPPLREQDLKKLRAGLSPQTCNHYLVNARTFCQWLKRPRKLITHNPLDGMKGFDKKALATSRRYRRRALEPAEQALLWAYMPGAPVLCGMSGAQRLLVYNTEFYTGLRGTELCGVRVRDFHLDKGHLTLPAHLSKARREEDIPLHSSLFEPLRTHFAQRDGDTLAFDLPHPDTLVDMARRDYVAAGIKIDKKTGRDASGRVLDFYSLRHSFGTNLARTSASASQHAELMRHKDPKTTRNYYTHLRLSDSQEALEKLPPPPPPQTKDERKIG